MTAPTKTLSALLQRTTIDDHEEVLKACNASLKQSKGDLELQHVKFVALLKLDRYDDALRVLEEGGDRLKNRAEVERAYALYKNGELEEAKKIAKAISNNRGARHVEAQAVGVLFPKRARGLVLTYGASHIALRTSRILLRSTRSCWPPKLRLRMRRVTYGSIVELRMRSSNGIGRGVWCKRRSR